MQRTHLFISPLGAVLTTLLLVGLGLSLWVRGGLAFSPGQVSAQSNAETRLGGFGSHAEFEKECSRCHQPLKGPQAGLCVECHKNIRAEIASGNGVHSKIEQVQQCAGCHREHQGRDYNLNLAALAHFDHSLARFSLLWHQVNYDATPLSCRECHTAGEQGFPFSGSACSACHADHDPNFMSTHGQDFGENCLACHDGKDRMASFDHSSTAFRLAEKHAQVACVQCHTHERQSQQPAQPFASTPVDCAGCHAEPPTHRAVFGPACGDCHTPAGWTPASLNGAPFTHEKSTSFSLARHTQDYAGQLIPCSGCHPSGIQTITLQVCVVCHAGHAASFMQEHTQKFGQDCLACHDGVDRMHDFDHAKIFPLEGQHAKIGCQDCHTGQKFRGTPAACSSCHAEPKIHAGFFGLQCQDCHSADAWSPAFLRVHDFPLDHGGQGQRNCQTCHPSRYVEYTCFGCHDHQPGEIEKTHAHLKISSTELNGCVKCHPGGNKK